MKLVDPIVKYYLDGEEVTTVLYDKIVVTFRDLFIDDTAVENGYNFAKEHPGAIQEKQIEKFLNRFAKLQMASNRPVDFKLVAGQKNIGSVAGLLNAFQHVTIENAYSLHVNHDIVPNTIRAKSVKFDGCTIHFDDRPLIEMERIEFIGSVVHVGKATFIAQNIKATDVTFYVTKKQQLTMTGARSTKTTEVRLISVKVISDGENEKTLNLKPLVRLNNFKTTKYSDLTIRKAGHRVCVSITDTLRVSADTLKIDTKENYKLRSKVLNIVGCSDVKISGVSLSTKINPSDMTLIFVGGMTKDMSISLSDIRVPTGVLMKITQELNKVTLSRCTAKAVLAGRVVKIQTVDISECVFDRLVSMDPTTIPTELVKEYVPDFNRLHIETSKFLALTPKILFAGGTVNLIRSEFRSNFLTLVGTVTLDNSIFRCANLTILGDRGSFYAPFLRGSKLIIKMDTADIQGADKQYVDETIVFGSSRGEWINIRQALAPLSNQK